MAERYTQVARATLWLVQGDQFVMGGGQPDAEPAFPVEVASFYIGKTIVTNEQYQAFAPGFQRCPDAPGDDDPAVGVSFEDAVGYCRWYSRLSSKTFRLPSEAEWEFACRAGTTGRYFFGEDPAAADAYVWHRTNADGRPHPADSGRANPFGLHAMLGNVWQWTSSLYLPYPVRDGDGRDDPETPGLRVLRGGSYASAISEMGSSVRRGEQRDAGFADVGFRIVRSL